MAHKLDGTVVAQKVNRATRKNREMRDLMRQWLNEPSVSVQNLLIGKMSHLLGDQFETLVQLDAEIRSARSK